MTNILVVDQSMFHRVLVEALFHRDDCSVFSATSGKEGYELFLSKKPRVIVLEHDLGDMTGDRFCKMVREKASKSQTALVVLAFSTVNDDKENCLKAGCDNYLFKPINSERLLTTISEHVPIIKRRFERAPIYTHLKYSFKEKTYDGAVHIIGGGGAFIFGEKLFPTNTEINLEFSIKYSSKPVFVTGKVVYQVDPEKNDMGLLGKAKGMGVEFTEISDEAHQAIITFIKKENA